MATLSATRSYEDGEVLVEADLDAFLDDIETFINTTKFNDDNIQNSGITGSTKLLNASVTESKLAANAVSTNKLAADAVTTAKILDANVTAAKLAPDVVPYLSPVGAVSAFAGTSAPSGWLLCDGSAVSRTTYSALYAVTSIAFGQGDGTTTFNVPDLRGRFVRGIDGSADRDPNKADRTAMNTGGNTGNALGSVQGGATALPNTAFTTDDPGTHTHTYSQPTVTATSGNTFSASPTQDRTFPSGNTGASGAHTHEVDGGGDDETRPINAYLNYIIKY